MSSSAYGRRKVAAVSGEMVPGGLLGGGISGSPWGRRGRHPEFPGAAGDRALDRGAGQEVGREHGKAGGSGRLDA